MKINNIEYIFYVMRICISVFVKIQGESLVKSVARIIFYSNNITPNISYLSCLNSENFKGCY